MAHETTMKKIDSAILLLRFDDGSIHQVMLTPKQEELLISATKHIILSDQKSIVCGQTDFSSAIEVKINNATTDIPTEQTS